MLKINTKKLGAVTVLCLEGQIITGDTDTLRGAVQSVSETNDVVLDLSNVNVQSMPMGSAFCYNCVNRPCLGECTSNY